MRIYRGLITLDFDPATDVLQATMPDMKQLALAEMRFCFELIVDTIRTYNVPYLLLDSSKSVVEVKDEEYQSIIRDFSLELTKTHLKKLARLRTTDAAREERAAALASNLRLEVNLPVRYENFTSRAKAMEWLLSS